MFPVFTQFRAASLASCAFVLSGMLLCGCASSKEKPSADVGRLGAGDTSFAAGANRAPTADTSYSFAKILVGQGRDREATQVLARIIRDHPKFLPAYNELAGIYLRSDRLDDSIATLSAALTKSPRDGVLLNNLGMCCLLKGDHAQALQKFSQAAEANPSNPQYRANRATALGMLGRDKEAEKEYRSILGVNPTRENLRILSAARKREAVSSIDETTTPEAIAPTIAPSAPARPEPIIAKQPVAAAINPAPAALPAVAIAPAATTQPVKASIIHEEAVALTPIATPTVIKSPSTAPTAIIAPTTAPAAIAKAPTTAPSVIHLPTTAPAIAKAPTTAPAVAHAPTTAPAIVKAPTTAPAITIAQTTAPAIVKAPAIVIAPTTAPAIVIAPTTAPAIVKAPTTAPAIAPAIVKAPTTAPAVAIAPTPTNTETKPAAPAANRLFGVYNTPRRAPHTR